MQRKKVYINLSTRRAKVIFSAMVFPARTGPESGAALAFGFAPALTFAPGSVR